MKRKRAPVRTKHSNEKQSSGHSSDDEPLGKMNKSKRSPPPSSDRRQESALNQATDSEEDQPLTALMKKKKRASREETGMPEQGDANKATNPKTHKTGEKASNLRQSSPAKTPQKRGRKGKQDSRRMASGHATPENTTPKKRGRPKKEDPERKAPSGDDSCEDEPLVRLVKKKKKQPQMKQAVVLLKRLSKRDVMDAITQRDTHSQERSSTARAGADSSDEELLSQKLKRLKQPSKPAKDRTAKSASSDDEPLVRRVKAAAKRRKRSNGDTPKQESELGGDDLKNDSEDECLVKRKSDRASQPLHRESSS